MNATTILVRTGAGYALYIRTETSGHILNQATLQKTLKMRQIGF